MRMMAGRWRWMVMALALMTVAGATAQPPAELVVRNGRVFTDSGMVEADVRVRDGIIAEIGRNLSSAAGGREIDARGLLVLPGGIDPHVHLGGAPRPGADDYTTGSRAALAGGITTIANFVSPAAGEDPAATLARAGALVAEQAIADVLLHLTVNDPGLATSANLAMLAKRGVAMKIFLSRPGFDQNAAAFLDAIRAAGAAGLLTMLHCEDAAILTTTAERMMAEGRSAIRHFAESRPVVAEEVATQRAIAMSEATGAPIYIVHLSSERALRVAEAAQARRLPVFVETRILYLHLTQERFEQPDGNIYTGFPPLREKHDVNALWDGIARGTVHVVATDHVSYTREEKMDPSVNIVNARPAGNYLQVNLPLLYSEGVRKGRITLEQMVAVTSTNPAKLFGLYPQKGTIAVGSDGDLVIWDPNLTRPVRDEDQFSNAKFSIFAGWELTGWPIVTIRRGDVVYEDGKLSGLPGSGRLAPRRRWRRPAGS